MTLTHPTLEPLPQVGYLDYERTLGDESAWQPDRVFFPRCRECITEKIRAMAEFSTVGWDGAHAKPIDANVIDAACRLIRALEDHDCGVSLIQADSETDCLVPHCVPLVSGGVQLEWHVGGRILELEFESADTIRYLKWWPGHDVPDDEASYPADDIEQSAALIRWVCYGDKPAAP